MVRAKIFPSPPILGEFGRKKKLKCVKYTN